MGRPGKKKNPGVGVDFKRVRAKVGKKLPRAANATSTEAKVKAIRVTQQSVAADRGEAAVTSRGLTLKEVLGQLSHYAPRVRVDALRGLTEISASAPDAVRASASTVLAAAFSRAADDDAGARAALRSLLSASLLPALGPGPVRATLPLLVAHLRSGLTHLGRPVRDDALALLRLLADYAPAEIARDHATPVLEHLATLLAPGGQRGTSVAGGSLDALARDLAAAADFLGRVAAQAAVDAGGGEGLADAVLGEERDRASSDNVGPTPAPRPPPTPESLPAALPAATRWARRADRRRLLAVAGKSDDGDTPGGEATASSLPHQPPSGGADGRVRARPGAPRPSAPGHPTAAEDAFPVLPGAASLPAATRQAALALIPPLMTAWAACGAAGAEAEDGQAALAASADAVRAISAALGLAAPGRPRESLGRHAAAEALRRFPTARPAGREGGARTRLDAALASLVEAGAEAARAAGGGEADQVARRRLAGWYTSVLRDDGRRSSLAEAEAEAGRADPAVATAARRHDLGALIKRRKRAGDAGPAENGVAAPPEGGADGGSALAGVPDSAPRGGERRARERKSAKAPPLRLETAVYLAAIAGAERELSRAVTPRAATPSAAPSSAFDPTPDAGRHGRGRDGPPASAPGPEGPRDAEGREELLGALWALWKRGGRGRPEVAEALLGTWRRLLCGPASPSVPRGPPVPRAHATLWLAAAPQVAWEEGVGGGTGSRRLAGAALWLLADAVRVNAALDGDGVGGRPDPTGPPVDAAEPDAPAVTVRDLLPQLQGGLAALWVSPRGPGFPPPAVAIGPGACGLAAAALAACPALGAPTLAALRAAFGNPAVPAEVASLLLAEAAETAAADPARQARTAPAVGSAGGTGAVLVRAAIAALLILQGDEPASIRSLALLGALGDVLVRGGAAGAAEASVTLLDSLPGPSRAPEAAEAAPDAPGRGPPFAPRALAELGSRLAALPGWELSDELAERLARAALSVAESAAVAERSAGEADRGGAVAPAGPEPATALWLAAERAATCSRATFDEAVRLAAASAELAIEGSLGGPQREAGVGVPPVADGASALLLRLLSSPPLSRALRETPRPTSDAPLRSLLAQATRLAEAGRPEGADPEEADRVLAQAARLGLAIELALGAGC